MSAFTRLTTKDIAMNDVAQRPQPNGPVREDEFHPAVRAAVEHISDTLFDRDGLRAENADLKNRAAIAEAVNIQLKRMLEKTEGDRDYYMRQVVELATKLSAAQNILLSAMEFAGRAPLQKSAESGEEIEQALRQVGDAEHVARANT